MNRATKIKASDNLATGIDAAAMPALHGPTGEAGASNLSTYDRTTFAEGTYVMIEADCRERFPDGTFIADLEMSHEFRHRYANGSRLVIKLNVPLCKGCDAPVVDNVCHPCRTVFDGERQ